MGTGVTQLEKPMQRVTDPTQKGWYGVEPAQASRLPSMIDIDFNQQCEVVRPIQAAEHRGLFQEVVGGSLCTEGAKAHYHEALFARCRMRGL